MHPDTTDLTDPVYLHKCLDTTGNADVFDKIIYMLNTGNLVSVGGLDLSQVSGFTVVADKLNFVRYISHFRSVHRGAFFMTLRTTAVRKLLPESWGFMCPVHTPDGSPCGLLNHLSRNCAAVVSTPEDPEAQAAAVTKELVRCGLMASAPGVAIPNPPSHLPVLLDGKVVGSVRAAEAPRMVAHMRTCKVDVASAVPEHTEVGYLPPARRASYPGIFLFTGTARMVRPVVQRAPLPGKVELVGPFEQVYLNIHCPDGGDGGR
jgi:DNA-directed RNA polymerase I subunit RPA2